MSSNDEVIQDFLIESREGLERLDSDLVRLEREPTSRELIASIFRSIHTIKGTSGFFGFERLETVTHSAESLLALLRDEMLKVDPAIISALLRTVDTVRATLDHIEAEGVENAGDDRALIAELKRLQGWDDEDEMAPAPASAASPAPSATPEATPAPSAAPAPVLLAEAPRAPEPPRAPEALPEPPRAPEAHAEQTGLEAQSASDAAHAQNAARTASDSSIRVDVAVLDKLMTLAGELVLTRNQILQYAATEQDSGLALTCQRLNVITSEMQESVMRTRMQPIDNVWSKFPRVVRDLAVSCGKQVRIEFEGKDTDLDRTILEAIKDPLTHIVRNAVDHGLEAPDLRLARGKPAEGVIRMRAFHAGGQVNIEISDDGGGLDLERIQRKAIDRGLITAAQAGKMNEREVSNLIFLPGFSTAEKVTNVSGRGVGMDVVRTNVERIGGAVEIESRFGHGTTIKVKIPLTLAIIPALIVRSGGDRYAIPQVSLLELVSFAADDANHRIEHIHGAPVYRLRGNLLPLVFLDQSLDLADGSRSVDAVRIVVLESEGRQFGLVVDEVNDSEEIVVKPLGRHLKGLSLFAGATILGDGAVALILDIRGLAQRANVLNSASERAREKKLVAVSSSESNKQTLLVVGVGIDERVAIPLSEVARLEEFKRSAVERSGGREVIQYRGEILPLVNLSNLLGRMSSNDETNLLQVIVCSHEEKSLGLVVDRILDIVEQEVTLQRSGGVQPGILGSAVIQQRVTELLDLPVAFSSMALS